MLTHDVCELLQSLPAMDYQTPRAALPSDGIYIFFEHGEVRDIAGSLVPRIVRIGTHRVNGRFPGRMRDHYGPARRLGGNKNASVFRRHLGGAILRRDDPADVRLPEWVRQNGQSYPEVELAVSQYLRDHMTFVCFQVDQSVERLSLESGLIALLAQHPIGPPSSSWLGLYAVNSDIRESGLWNTNHVRDSPLSTQQFDRLTELVVAMGSDDENGASHRPLAAPSSMVTIRSEVPVASREPDESAPESSAAGRNAKPRTLVIVPCGSSKIWDRIPTAGPTLARNAYIGPPFVVNRHYAEHFGDDWVILSAKFGFIRPDYEILESYDVSFKYKRSNPVTTDSLRAQVAEQGLGQYDRVIALGGKDYAEPVKRAFAGIDVELTFPFLGLTIGRMMSATQRAVSSNCPIPRRDSDPPQ